MKKLQDYGIEHIGFLVSDLDKALEHFKQVYGIDNFKVYDFSPTRAWSYGKEVKDYKLKIAMSDINSTSSGIEIIQHVSGEGVHKDFVESGHNGMHHIAFRVDDYDEWRTHFLNKGAKFIFESETEDDINGYRRCFYADDPDEGMVYEIKEKAHFRK